MFICTVFLGTPDHLACLSTLLIHCLIEYNWLFFIISQYRYVTVRQIPVKMWVKYQFTNIVSTDFINLDIKPGLLTCVCVQISNSV
jgi:hypothetical protein